MCFQNIYKGLKFMIDMVMNHCSDQHPWFKMSKERVEPYTDYFVWKDAKGYDTEGNPIPPNNWVINREFIIVHLVTNFVILIITS